jgi:hypothetical protein
MVDIRDWSTTAASNTDIAPEGMAPGGLNDAIRAVQAEVAQLNADGSGTATTGGTSTAYTLTLSTSPASLSDGLNFSFTANATSGASPTLNVNSFGAKKLRKFTNGAEEDLAAGDLVANGHYQVQYDSAANGGSGAYIILNPTNTALVFLSSGSVSAAATLDLTLPSGYRSFRLVLGGVEPATAGASLNWRISVDSGSTYIAASYDYASVYQTTSGTPTAQSGAAATSALLGVAQTAAGGYPGSFDVLIIPGNGSSRTSVSYRAHMRNNSALETVIFGGGASYATNSRPTNFRIFYGSGNISAGYYQLYGLRG